MKGMIIINNKKEIKIRKGKISESKLVESICTEKQIQAYMKSNRFKSGAEKDRFITKLGQYCEYDYDKENKMFQITNVFDCPKSSSLVKMQAGIYKHMAPIIINAMIYNCDKNNKITIPTSGFARMIYMINENYNIIKYNQTETSTDLSMELNTISDFLQRTDGAISYYISQCLKYLQSDNYIISNRNHIICTISEGFTSDDSNITKRIVEDVHVASDEEMDMYRECHDIASKRARIKQLNECYFGRKAPLYQKILKQEFKKHNIKYVCNGYDLYCVNKDRAKLLLNEFEERSMEENALLLSMEFKNLLVTNAEKRVSKLDEEDVIYCPTFEKLSDITIIKGAEDIKPQLPSLKSAEEKLSELSDQYSVRIKVDTKNNLRSV